MTAGADSADPRADRRTAVGSLAVSLAAHASLFLFSGWLTPLQLLPPNAPLTVELWRPELRTRAMPPADAIPSPIEREVRDVTAPPEPDVDRETESVLRVDAAPLEPAPEEHPRPDLSESVVADPLPSSEVEAPPEPALPRAPIAWDAPPDEIERPNVDGDLPTNAEWGVTEGVRPFEGEFEAPPVGPARDERDRRLRARAAHRAQSRSEREGRVRGIHADAPAPIPRVPIFTASGPLASDEGVEGPLGNRRLLYRESPPYPEWAQRAGFETDVALRVWVNPAGLVSRVVVSRRSGNTELDDLAERALRAWRFEPLPSVVEQRDEWGEVTMSFRLVAESDR